MGQLLPQYRKAIIEDVINSITANTSEYYAFASNPITFVGSTPNTTNDDYSSTFTNDWQMLFGKKISNGNIVPVILNNTYKSGTVYNRYDNTIANLSNYYVVSPPSTVGGGYNIYKCIDNANGSISTVQPNVPQLGSFTTSDGYTWRYITSVSSAQYNATATINYIPATTNTTVVSSAYTYSGVEFININDGGSGYICVANGVFPSNPVNTTVLQIQSNASGDNDFYTKNSIYIYNTGSPTGQLRTITKYTSYNGLNYVYLDSPIDTSTVSTTTNYYISPKVVFQTDGNNPPVALSYINTSGNVNSISTIQIIDPGYGVSWANVSIQSNTTYGSGANLYAIVPPAGGHGSNPQAELGIEGFVVSFFFSNTENGTILGNTQYNKIGLLKSPYKFSNTAGSPKTSIQKTTAYSANTFSAVLQANVNPSGTIFTIGDTVTGQLTNAVGTVAFSNSTVVCLTGDKYFSNNEKIVSSSGLVFANISINTFGDIYTKDLSPIYIQNISNVTRSSTQAESFKLIIKI
jgi:hypothetical protein